MKIQTQIERIRYELDGPIEDAIQYLQNLKDEADSAGVEYILDYTSEFDYGNVEYQVIAVIERREETAEEIRERLELEEERNKAQVAKKRKQFEDLKKELGE